ncbi:hypothetical protein AAZX31_13G082100 [Glycine max]
MRLASMSGFASALFEILEKVHWCLCWAPSRDWEDSDHTWDSKYTILHATPTRMHSKGVVLACSPIDAALVATAGSDDRRFLRKIGLGDWAFELQGGW